MNILEEHADAPICPSYPLAPIFSRPRNCKRDQLQLRPTANKFR